MRLSKLYMPTLREVPADAEIASHKYLLRAAMIRKSASGVYSYLPLGYRVIRKIENIVREEMDASGSQEILMSAIQPAEIWQRSGRWSKFGPEMFKLKDRHDRDFCLGPTAEEYFTTLVDGELNSYKQLPIILYQIQTKYRDELRPRFGINRAREFSMKDAYSFDKDEESSYQSYMLMYRTYEKIFDRMGLKYKIVMGDNGAMGGNLSHEFIALSEAGEGEIVYSKEGKEGATVEKAKVNYEFPEREQMRELKKVHTPEKKTIEEVSEFLGVDKKRCAKAIDLLVEGKPTIVFIPGDRNLNMSKLVSYLGVGEHEIVMMEDDDILKINSAPGYTGPVELRDVRIIVDNSLTKIENLIVGANEKDHHYVNVNWKRDFDAEVCEDLLLVERGDKFENGEEYSFARGIEVGNIFSFGTKYSEALNVSFLDENGSEKYFQMGSYGVGITRSVTAVIEQNHDEDGIIWPINLAPYEAIVTVINPKKEDQMKLAEEIYNHLLKEGVEVLFDDRDERAGVKFKDRDLIGIPLRITVGKRAQEDIVEFSTRRERQNEELEWMKAAQIIVKEVKEAGVL